MFSKSVTISASRHLLFFEEMGPGLSNDDNPFASIAHLLDWCLGFQCITHGGSNALKWGLHYVSSEQLLKDVHVMLASLIVGSQKLHDHVLQRQEPLQNILPPNT